MVNTKTQSLIIVNLEDCKLDTSETRAVRVQHECDTNDPIATRVKNFDFDNDTSKTYFHNPILAIWQLKYNKEMNRFILRTTFWKHIVPMPKCVPIVHHKK